MISQKKFCRVFFFFAKQKNLLSRRRFHYKRNVCRRLTLIMRQTAAADIACGVGVASLFLSNNNHDGEQYVFYNKTNTHTYIHTYVL